MRKALLTLCLLAVLAGSLGLAGKPESHGLQKSLSLANAEELSRMQEHAVSIADRIHRSFSSDANGMTVYPDEFGGCFVDGAVLVVYLKDTDQETVNRYTAFAGDEKQFIRIKKVRYSRNELQKIADELAAVFRTKGDVWYSYGVDDMKNAVSFVAKREDVKRMKREAAKRYPGVPCTIEPGGPVILD